MFAALLATWKWAVPDFNDKIPYTRSTAWIPFASLPLILAQIHLLFRYDPKSTWLLRASLIPVILLISLRSAYAYYYMVDGDGQLDGRGQSVNVTLGCYAITAIIRSLEFGLARQRPRLKVRNVEANGAANGNGNAKKDSNGETQPDRMPIFFPGTPWPLELDLLVGTRAVGWEHGIKDGAPALPVPTYTPLQRWTWILKRVVPLPFYYLLYDAILVLLDDVRFNVNANSRVGASIWNSTQGSFGVAGPALICMAFASTFVCIQAMMHSLMACFFVGVFNDLPSRWDPPCVRLPWLSTSVADFWSKRWHQYLRITFMTVGYWPVRDFIRPIAGRRIANIAAIFGTFLVSGILHDLGQAAMTPGFGTTHITLFFVVQPIAMFCEQLFEHCTRRRVGGFWGWLWTVSWILTTAPLLLEAFNQGGMLAADNQYFAITRRPVTLALNWWDHIFNGV